MTRVFRLLGLAVAFLLAGVFATFLWYREASLPVHEGVLVVPRLSAATRVTRDESGVPFIEARTEADALFALGFAHAQDRLWQMDFNRRIARGRLAEILGRAALESDKFIRTLGITRTARSIVEKMDAETRALVEAYGAGVNAYLTTRRGPLPPEFLLTRAPAPLPWTPEDSIGWALMMSWDMASAGYRAELARLRLSARLSMREIDEFRPLSPDEPGLRTADYVELYRLLGAHVQALGDTAARLMASHPVAGFGAGEAIGSNAWVVGAALSSNGKPLLANDPHLGLTSPSVWYFARLRAPGIDVVGATLPGVPYVLLGRNANVAWGMTNTGGDVQDVYIERLHPTDRDQYQTPDGYARFETHIESIRVRGEDDVQLSVRSTRHGPVISGIVSNIDKALPAAARGRLVLALRWAALEPEDQSLRALRAMNRAADAEQFQSALSDWQLVQQTVLFADAHGRIGMLAAGRIPVRSADNDLNGLAPAPGWDAKYDWTGWLPFTQVPREVDPPRGYIVSANHRITPPGYAHFINAEWYLPYRAQRIDQLLRSTSQHSSATFKKLQADIVSLAANDLLQVLRETQPATPVARLALERLQAWGGAMRLDAPEPLLLHTWLHRLRARIFNDDLGDLADDFVRSDELTLALLTVLRGETKARDWCDDRATSTRRETCLELAAETLDEAVADLARSSGRDVFGLRWGDERRAVFEHRPLSNIGAVRDWFELRVPFPGDSYTINVGRLSLRGPAPFNTRHAASLRAVYDLADPRAGGWMLGTGQSGNPLSDQYGSMLSAWRDVRYLPLPWDPPAAGSRAARVLVLQPSQR